MSPEIEPKLKFTVSKMSIDDVELANLMRLDCWLDTYVSEEFGITRDWIKERNLSQMTDEKNEIRKERLKDAIHHAGWVAKDSNGEIIGSTTPYISDDGKQDIGSLYVNKKWHGKGVANELMNNAIDWFDKTQPIELCVASYNERAKAFYRKWGFEEVPDSIYMFTHKIPTIIMIRKGDNKDEI